ncbi:hypothetical protein MJH12_11430, partial [bacterium]|nr:hypothetical protein [bacterium]
MIFWFTLAFAIFITVALSSLALGLFDYKKSQILKQKDAVNKDAQEITKISHTHLGTPYTTLERSKF